MTTKKDVGADAAAVVTAGSIASDAASRAVPSPLPWTVFRGESNVGPDLGTWGAVRDHDGFIVAELWDDTDDLAHSVVANAHLIAAAPELLALAKFVVEHPRAAYGMGDVPHAERCEMQSLALAAIAKAEGRS